MTIGATAFDIDMFDTPVATIKKLHSQGSKVICYFSAGTAENWRTDAASFLAADKGDEVDGWPREVWVNTKSTNVRNIMLKRLDLAKSKGCDAVDPDNTDAYDNDGGGLGLVAQDATNYVTFLANAAHARGMAVGLKNSGDIITPAIISLFDFAVNEQCEKYKECADWRPFITAKKPVFGIEYPSGGASVTVAAKAKICDNPTRAGFSTLLKKVSLDEWFLAC